MPRCADAGRACARSPSPCLCPRRAAARRFVALGLAAGLGWTGLATSVAAQTISAPPGHRIFPATALRGALVIDAPPVARLNGQPARLAPGARIRGENGLLQTPASLVGRALTVHYTWEPSTGLLMDVWILNAVEQTHGPWPSNAQDARTWRFDPAAQRWSRP